MADGKNRHGCLTAWLILMIVVNSVVAFIYLLGSAAIGESLPNMPEWAFPVLIVMSLFNLVCAIALLRWKKWGFCASSAVALVVNLSIGTGIGTSLSGLVGVLLLYGVLNIGSENKGWPQLD